MAYGIVNADQIGTSVAGSNLGAGNASLLKNRLINGAMTVSQRGTSFTNPNGYTLDRWYFATGSATATITQSSTAPTGFANSLYYNQGATTWSPSGAQWGGLVQSIEGFNTYDLGFGTASAKTVTLSFWVQASVTGTYAVTLNNATGASTATTSATRCYVATFTVSAANTWEYKTITIAGDTTGNWTGSTNSGALTIVFNAGSSSTYTTATTNAWQAGSYLQTSSTVSLNANANSTLYVSGVQLEVGSSATGFEYVNYQTSLNNCMRYFEQWNGGSQYAPMGIGQIGNGNAFAYVAVPLVYKRTVPTVTLSSLAGGTIFSAYGTNASGGSFPWSGNLSVDTTMTGNLGVDIQNTLGNSTAGGAGTCVFMILRANQYIQFSAEL